MNFRIGVGTFTTTDKMRQLINQALDSNRISYGPVSKEFEARFAHIHNCNHAVLSNSGTSSLQVALQAMKEIHGWHHGDEVIVPATTFVATPNIVLHNLMWPEFVDVDRYTYNIDPALIEEKINDRTRAIIPVHLFGQPADMLSITMIAKKYGLKVIEDSCECMFATHLDEKVGSLGDIGCFSTYVAHLITTGVGGIATTNNPEYAAKMRSLVNHGRDGIYIDMDTPTSAEVISRRFNFESVGHSFRITELEAALGLAQLDDWQDMIRTRQYNARMLTALLNPYRHWLQLPKILVGNTHSWMMYPIVVKEGGKEHLVNYLEMRGIETRDMLPLVNQPIYELNPDDYPVSKWLVEGGFYVGIHQNLTEDDLAYMGSVFASYYLDRE